MSRFISPETQGFFLKVTTRSEDRIQSSLRYDKNPTVGNGIARNSFFASGMQRAALTISIVACLSLLGWVMLRCRYGFDFTDEGFYLNWISNPWNYRSSITQFGFVYHPLYKFVGGDIVLLRQANVLILFVLGWALCATLLRSIFIQRDSVGASLGAGAIGTALVAGAGSLSYFDLWLPTPNYNSLTFQSLMLVAIGALLAGRELSKPSVVGWILVGIGSGLAFLAKPTSAAMLGCMVVFYLAAAGKFRLSGLSISIAVAVLFLVVAALAIDGSLLGFTRRVINGIDIGNRLAAGHSLAGILRWDGINLSGEQKSNFTFLLITAFLTTTLVFSTNGFAQFAAALIVVVLSAACIAIFAGVLFPHISNEPFQPVQFAAVSLGTALAAILFRVLTCPSLLQNSVAVVFFLAVLPFTYAFGTNTNYWSAAVRVRDSSGFSPALFFVPEFAATNAAWHKLLPAAALALWFPLACLYAAMENPYRQTQPLRLQASAVDITPGKSRLFLTAGDRRIHSRASPTVGCKWFQGRRPCA